MKSMRTQNKPIPISITNSDAILLVQQRAKRESRSMSNAAAVTIIEALQSKSDNNEVDRQNQD